MTENKQPLNEYTGTYIGKEFVRSGESNGKQWTMYKVMFKENVTDQYPKKFSCFGSAKGFETLQEGEVYKLGYSEQTSFNNKVNKNITYKTAVWFGKPSNTQVTTNTNNVDTQGTLTMPEVKQEAPVVNSILDPEVLYVNEYKRKFPSGNLNDCLEKHPLVQKLFKVYNGE